TIPSILVMGTLVCGPAFAQQRSAIKRSPPAPLPAALEPAPEIKNDVSPDAGSRAKVVQVQRDDIVKVSAKIRYSTLIMLPSGDRILDFICGDKDFWIVTGVQNLAYVKPAKVGSQTNLTLVTASGNIYSFLLTEVSEVAGAVPDLKVV